MPSTLGENLKRELDDVSAMYNAQFAGQSRRTRDERALDALIARTEAALRQIDAVPAQARDSELAGLRDAAESALEMYRTERAAIVTAKAAGPGYDAFVPLAAEANALFARFRRHFDGKPRASRDLGLLDEMTSDLTAVAEAMDEVIAEFGAPPFRADRDVVERMLGTLRTERGAIAQAFTSGSAPQQADRMAELANAQFDIYRQFFAGRSRVICRPALLERVIRSLERVRARMAQLSRTAGVDSAGVRRNLAVVDGNLKTYRAELEEVRKVREATPLADLLGSLGGAANELFREYDEHYAGKDRRTVDLARLGLICDKLGEIGRQMRDFARLTDNEMNARNLEIVAAQLASYDREWDQVEQAQRQR